MIRIATRRSALARAQAFQTGQLISERTGEDFELVPLATTGDAYPHRPVGAFESKGLFVDALRDALLDGYCDIAVHSYKDLPTQGIPGIVIAAVPPREDPRDVLVTRVGEPARLSTLAPTATVGTSSERRRVELLRSRPSLQVLPLRGNLDTRLRKVAECEFDAVVVAFAGLCRLYVPKEMGGVGRLELPLAAVPLEPGECLPAPGQGALAIECRAEDAGLLALCKAVDDFATHHAVRAERAYLQRLGGGCLAPVGALGRLVSPGQMELMGMLACPVTRRVIRRSLRGSIADPERLGAMLTEDIDDAGGSAMLETIAELRGREDRASQPIL